MVDAKRFGASLSYAPQLSGVRAVRRRYSFNQVKLQILEIANEHDAVQKAAAELFFHLTLAELWRHNGTAVIRDSDLAEVKGWSTDKVSRAVRDLMLVGIIEVERGRWNRSTEYHLPDWLWEQAMKRRDLAQKVTDFGEKVGPQKCANSIAKAPIKTPQKSGATKEKNKRKTTRDPLVPGMVAKTSTFALHQWDTCLQSARLGRLVDILEATTVDGVEGYWLPAQWPAGPNTELLFQQMQMIRGWIQADDK